MQLMEAVSLFNTCLEFIGFFTDNIVDGDIIKICKISKNKKGGFILLFLKQNLVMFLLKMFKKQIKYFADCVRSCMQDGFAKACFTFGFE